MLCVLSWSGPLSYLKQWSYDAVSSADQLDFLSWYFENGSFLSCKYDATMSSLLMMQGLKMDLFSVLSVDCSWLPPGHTLFRVQTCTDWQIKKSGAEKLKGVQSVQCLFDDNLALSRGLRHYSPLELHLHRDKFLLSVWCTFQWSKATLKVDLGTLSSCNV